MGLKDPYQTLIKIGEEINSTHEISILLDRIMDAAMQSLQAERGFILLKNIGMADYHVVTARNLSQETITSIRDHSSSVVQKVMDEHKALISIDAQADERFAGAESVIVQNIKSVISTPLLFKDELIGAIYMDSRISKRKFDDESLDFLNAFSTQAAIAINNAQLVEKLRNENKTLRLQVSFKDMFPEIIGHSQVMNKIFELIKTVAHSTATILIEGESGTGKELVARALHKHSQRSDGPFIPIFCGSLSENLLESELFGHKKGSFTGASDNKSGLFEDAHMGTVFLDEIAEVSPALQTKLLRVIQEGELKRVGDNQIRKVDVRLISATNKDLWKEVDKGNFREDLFYRLNVINIKMPTLQERTGDIHLLAEYFLKYFSDKNKKNFKGFTKEALNYLEEYHWPGNVRELENTIERAVILCSEEYIGKDFLIMRKAEAQMPLGKSLKEINKFAILKTIEITGGNRTQAARILDVSRRWLQYQLKEWGMVDDSRES